MTKQLKAPFPYFGNKSNVTGDVWKRFGEVTSYIEPFCGSAAMLLAAPKPARVETINDADGFVANFWRAVAWDPAEVAYWADWPVNEVDLESRHAWLVNRSKRLRWALEDPEYYDAKIAGWWVWGACAWIGSGWCSGKGPHVGNGAHIMDSRELPEYKYVGSGINSKIPNLGNASRFNFGTGINRSIPNLGNAGRLQFGSGINRSLTEFKRKNQTVRGEFILDWFLELHARLRDVRVVCGDWKRVLTNGTLGTTKAAYPSMSSAVFFDPPYADGKINYSTSEVNTDIAKEVEEWCLKMGDNPKVRIALCGHAGDHDALEEAGWDVYSWKRGNGYGKTKGASARREEEIWFSPHCLPNEDAAPKEVKNN